MFQSKEVMREAYEILSKGLKKHKPLKPFTIVGETTNWRGAVIPEHITVSDQGWDEPGNTLYALKQRGIIEYTSDVSEWHGARFTITGCNIEALRRIQVCWTNNEYKINEVLASLNFNETAARNPNILLEESDTLTAVSQSDIVKYARIKGYDGLQAGWAIPTAAELRSTLLLFKATSSQPAASTSVDDITDKVAQCLTTLKK